MAGYKYSQIKMRRDGRSEAAVGLPEESPPPLANIDIYSSISMKISSRPGRAGHHFGWEWLSPHASFDESTPAEKRERNALYSALASQSYARSFSAPPRASAEKPLCARAPFFSLLVNNRSSSPNVLGATQHMSSSLQDPPPREQDAGRDGAGSQTYPYFPWACLAPNLNKGWAPKRKQPSLFKKALLGRRCLLTRTML